MGGAPSLTWDTGTSLCCLAVLLPAQVVLTLAGEGEGERGETFMETGDLCLVCGGNGGCHGDSFSK